MKKCKASKSYDHKAARAKQTPEQIYETLNINQKQYAQAMKELPIDCAGVECKRKRLLLHMYRCWYCGKYFCPICSKEHFGNRS